MSTKKNELTPFTFKDSGKTVLIKKVSPLVLMEMQKQFPEPTPPTQEVEINGKKVIEPNYSHPDYLIAKQEYTFAFENKMRKFLIRRGVTVNMSEEVKQEIAQIKADYFEDTGAELQGSDEFIYVSFIAIGTDQDMEDLMSELTQRSQPTDLEVAAAKKSFPG